MKPGYLSNCMGLAALACLLFVPGLAFAAGTNSLTSADGILPGCNSNPLAPPATSEPYTLIWLLAGLAVLCVALQAWSRRPSLSRIATVVAVSLLAAMFPGAGQAQTVGSYTPQLFPVHLSPLAPLRGEGVTAGVFSYTKVMNNNGDVIGLTRSRYLDPWLGHY
jgi:hypothetical protein